MAKARNFNLIWPTGGVVRRHQLQHQPPYTTPTALNVWPVGPYELRQRGGRRAGLTKQASSAAAAGPYRGMISVPKADDSSYTYRLMCCVGSAFFYPTAGGAMTSWATGTLASSSGRLPWAVRQSKIYLLDGTNLEVMDPYAPSLANVVASAGTLPSGCDLIYNWRDRCVLAPRRGHVWYMSRAGAWTDWDYSPSGGEGDAERAVSAQSAEAGELQQPLNAFVPADDQYCYFGMDNSLFRMVGDPATRGILAPISQQVGIIGPDAWAMTPNEHLLFVDWSGIYLLPKGSKEVVPFSHEKLPSDLRNIDPATYEVVLRYAPQHFGFLMAIVPVTGATDADPGTFWWLDWPTKSFWELSFSTDNAPRFFERFAWSTGYDEELMLGCEDGYLRALDEAAVDDDGTDITAYCDIGPFRVAGNDVQDGLIRSIVGTMAADSADVTWKLFVGNNAEAVADSATERTSGTWVAGRNYTVSPRARGGAAKLRLHGTTRWAFETAAIEAVGLGKQRIP